MKVKYFMSYMFIKGKIKPEQGMENEIVECEEIKDTIDLRSIEQLLCGTLEVEMVKITNIVPLEKIEPVENVEEKSK